MNVSLRCAQGSREVNDGLSRGVGGQVGHTLLAAALVGEDGLFPAAMISFLLGWCDLGGARFDDGQLM